LSFKKTTTTTTTTTSATTEAELAKQMKNTKVLVVEDIPLNQLLIKTILVDFGVQFDIAGNGKIAIEKLQQNNYDMKLFKVDCLKERKMTKYC
jgi:PleD family two-component response regulator